MTALPRFTSKMQDEVKHEEISQIRCSSCGRFLGFHNIVEGEVYVRCKNCKKFTVILGGEAEKKLTGEQMYDRLVSGLKARQV